MKMDLGGAWEIMGVFGVKNGFFRDDLMELAPMDLIQVSHQNINETQREGKLKIKLKKVKKK